MRLPIAIPAAFFTFLGICISAPSYAARTHYMVPIFGFGVLSVGTQMGANLAMTYALDCHKEIGREVMVTISVIKSALAWTWSWFINDWIVRDGMEVVYLSGESRFQRRLSAIRPSCHIC